MSGTRRATYEDIPSLVRLLQQLFCVESDFDFDADKHRKGLELLIASTKDVVLVAVDEGRVVGMLTCQVAISTVQGGLAGVVEDVVVDSELKGRGIGKKLLMALEEWAKLQGITRLQLLADQDNKPALQFYEKAGWSTLHLLCLRKYVQQ